MASMPGPLTKWPWQDLGSFKYMVLAPWAAHSIHSYLTMPKDEKDLSYLAILPFILWRILHFQLWRSLSRFQTARDRNKIVQRGIEFEQVDREENWDDQILLNGLLLYLGRYFIERARKLPLWQTNGVILCFIVHMGPVEFLYYWLHRALHHHFLYSRYHSHHHLSIATEPNTAVIHPFIEVASYVLLFSMPQLAAIFTGTASIVALALYTTYIDFMNNLGHCNFELVPTWLFRAFPPLKYLMYTPSFHSLHHTQFRTNYSLFMPFYDYLYGTTDDSSDALYEACSKGKMKQGVDAVHLTHPTTVNSIYHLPLGWASFASNPYTCRWYLWLLAPFTWFTMLFTWILGDTFTVESNRLDKLQIQTWAVPRFRFHYRIRWQEASINSMIERAILDANQEGAKVISLGLLNQKDQLNGSGELYVQRHPNLKIRVVDGTALAVGVVLNNIPQGTKEVVLRGHLSKAGRALALALCLKGVKVVMLRRDEFKWLKLQLPNSMGSQLDLSSTCFAKVWLVGEGLTKEEQSRAPKGTCFIPFSQFPPTSSREDCIYYDTPALMAPKELENMHCCENWLPRRAMSAWRAAGIVHALEGWDVHECGEKVMDVTQVWAAASRHGFLLLPPPQSL